MRCLHMHFELCLPHVLPAFSSSSSMLASSSSHSCMRLHVSPLAPPVSMQHCVCVCCICLFGVYATNWTPCLWARAAEQRKEGGEERELHDRRTWRLTATRSAFLSIKLLDISLRTRIVYAYVYVCITYTLYAHSFISFLRKSLATFRYSFLCHFRLFPTLSLCMRFSSSLFVMSYARLCLSLNFIMHIL